jgi:D-allose transport system substrate-binding protein
MNIKNIKKLSLVLVSLLVCSLILVGCGGNKASNEVPKKTSETVVNTDEILINDKYAELEQKIIESLAPMPKKGDGSVKVAVVLPTLSNPFYVTAKKGYEDAAKDLGIQVEVVTGSAEDDTEGQLNAMKTILTKKPDVVVCSAINSVNLINGVAEANKLGIPVIMDGNDLDKDAAADVGAKAAAHMAYDFEGQGYIAASYLVKKIKAEGLNNAKVAVIEGLNGAFQGGLRRDGATRAFKEAGFNIVATQAGDWDRQKAYNIASNLIQANPDLKAIACANDTMALGVIEALKVAGKLDQVYVSGIDFIDEARQSMKNSEMDASVAMAPYMTAKGSLIMSLKLLQGHQVEGKSYYNPMALITQDNVNNYDDWQ